VKGPDVPDRRGARIEGPEVTASSLLEQVKTSDPGGWRRLVSLYGPLAYSWCRQAGLKSHDAADVVQEVFRAVWKHIGDFRRDRPGDSFRGWLRTITRNKVRDHWRRERVRPGALGGTEAHVRLSQVPDDAPPDEPENDDPSEANLVFRRALELVRSEFENRTWQAFWLTTVEDRDPGQVGAELGMTANAVYIAKSRVLSRVRAEFGELID